MKEKLVKVLSLILGIIFLGLMINFGMKWQKDQNEKYPWIGTLYKTANDSKLVRENGKFETLDKCRNWAQDKIRYYNEGNWDYECGTGCEYSDETIIGGKRQKSYKCSEITQ